MNGQFDPSNIMNMVRDFKEKMDSMNEQLGKVRVEADAGAGMVKVVANGRGEILEIDIDAMAAEGGDVPMLEDLVKAAVNEALRRAKSAAEEEQRKMLGGMPLPVDLSKLGGLI